MNRKIKAVIFDMDGVIFDSEACGLKCFLESCKQMGLEENPNPYLSSMGSTYEQSDNIMMEYFKDEKLFKDTMDIYNVLFHNAYSEGKVHFKKGAEEIIKYLTDNNIPFALATSSPMYMVDMSFSNQGYKQVPFKYIVTGDKVTNSKPHPEIFIKAANLMGVDPKDCAVIEDSRNGILAARRSEGLAILVPDMLEPDKEMKEAAHYILKDLTEVQKLIEKSQNQ